MRYMIKAVVTAALFYGGTGARSFAPAAPKDVPAGHAAPRRRALLVGVSSYCRGNDPIQCLAGRKYWWDLNSGPDVEALEQVLKNKFGFDDVRVLRTREETTHKNIVNVFRSFLIGQTEKGDIAYFHFSGHGSQVPDDTEHGPNPKVGDEIDGLDETLVPSDYVSQSDGSNDIRDDEIEILLDELRSKGPASVTVSMDSCFSGSNTRGGNSLVRGRRWSGPPPPRPTAGALPDGPSGLLPSGDATAKGYTVLSATRDDQLAFETEDETTHRHMGVFTSALVKAFEASDSATTYRDVIERVTDEVTRSHRDQEPQMEGDGDVLLMSGVPVRPPQPYVETNVEGDKVILQAGRLHGITPGSTFSLYPQGKDPGKSEPLAKAEVESVQLTTSVLKVTAPQVGPEFLKALRAARAVEISHSFGDARLKVAALGLASTEDGRDILDKLKGFDLVDVTASGTERWDVRICQDNCPDELLPGGEKPVTFKGGYTLQRSDGYVITRVARDANAAGRIGIVLEQEARWHYVKGLNSESDPDVRIRMRLVPVTGVEISPLTKLAATARKVRDEVLPTEGGQIELREGDYLMMEVMNMGAEDVWVSVLDINAEGGIGPLWPHPNVPVGLSGENKIPAAKDGKPVWTPIPLPFVVVLTKPYGWESFKAIATLDRTNFGPLFQHDISTGIQRGLARGDTPGADEARTPLGQALMTATTGLSRKSRGVIVGADPSNVALPPRWGTATITFLVKPKIN